MGLLVCCSVSSWIHFRMAMISFLLTFQTFSGACSKSPSLSIVTPEKLEALSGSCLQIPCSFSADSKEDFTGENVAVWFKRDSRFKLFPENLIFNSSWKTSLFPVEVTGDLEKKNCTTVFDNLSTEHSERFFFRIESKAFQATASSSGFNVKVTDSPWPPSINVPSDLKEHQYVTISCSALTPCPHSPPELTWNLQQDSHRQTEKNTDGTFTTKMQENITLSDSHDGYIIRCSARYPVKRGNKTAETEVTLNVSYAPRNTSASISPSGLLSAGSQVELSCSSRANPPPSFTWFRNSKHGAINVSVDQVHKLWMTNTTDLGSYYCVAENILGSETSTHSYLKNQGSEPSALWVAFLGGFVGIIAVICVALIFWRLKSKHSVLQQPQKPGYPENPEIHYGDIKFNVMRASLKKEQDVPDQQNVIYSQVRMCRTDSRPNKTVDAIYIHVQKKPSVPHST